MKSFYFLILISCSINADAAKISASDYSKFGCTGIHNDYYEKNTVDQERVLYSQLYMDKLTNKENDLYDFLKKNVTQHHYASEESVHSPGYFFNRYYFEYQGDKIEIYRSISPVEEKTIGFCFEGKFSNELVRKFFSVETIDKIKMNGDGDFYLLDDAYSVVKFVKKYGVIKEIYIYIDYD